MEKKNKLSKKKLRTKFKKKYRYTKKQRKKHPGHSVYILYTGGTIGMEHDKSKGLVPVKGIFKKLVNDLNLKHSLKIKYTVEHTTPIIDSSNLQSSNWKNIYPNYKIIIINTIHLL